MNVIKETISSGTLSKIPFPSIGKTKAVIYFSASLLLASTIGAQAQSGLEVRPLGDNRCLAQISGGFGLEGCNPSNHVTMSLSNITTIAYGDGICISVPVAGQGGNPWKDGTRLKKTSCATPEASSIEWKRQGDTIVAVKGGKLSSFCLTILHGPGSLRAGLLSCHDSQLTRWTFDS